MKSNGAVKEEAQPKVVIRVSGWVNLFQSENDTNPRALFKRRSEADEWASRLDGNKRIACVKVDGFAEVER